MSDARYKPVILQEHDAESRRLRGILDTATDEIYIYKLTKQTANLLGITIEEENSMTGVVGVWKINREDNSYETIIKDAKCPFCGEEALLKRSHSMDGISVDLYPSKYCPSCGARLLCFDKEETNE